MTKLEEEILNNILERGVAMRRENKDVTEIDRATFAAEVAKKYIEKAIVESVKAGWDMEAGDWPTVKGDSYFHSDLDRYKDQWLKENGVV